MEYIIMIEQKTIKKQSASSIHSIEPSISKAVPASSMPSIISNSFFEVTVNSEKLAGLFQNIDEIIFQQNRKMEKLNRDLNSIFAALEDKFQAESRKNGMLFTKLDLRINQSANAQHCYLMDVHRKAEQRDQELDKRIEAVASKIGKLEDTLRDDLRTGLINLKKEIIGDIQINEEEVQSQQPNPKTEPIQPVGTKIDFNYLIKHFEQELDQVRQSLNPVFNELYESKEQEKKKKHTQEMLDLTYKKDLQIAKENLKNDQSFMKVLYPSSKKGLGSKEREPEHERDFSKLANKLTRHMSLNKGSGIQEQLLHGYSQILQKIQKLEQTTHDQSQTIAELKNKQIVLDQKSTIMNRKVQKNCFQIAEIKTNFRRVQSQKLDDKTIEELRHYMKWAIRDLEEKINRKCSDEDLNRERIKLTEKISILHENLIEKADKGEIQKALVFLEGKIKQIIFLIAAEHTEQKQGAIMKVAAKCLSCDKEVQRQLQTQQSCKRQLNKQSQGQYIKSMTHRVRQRYKKEMAQTLGNETFDD